MFCDKPCHSLAHPFGFHLSCISITTGPFQFFFLFNIFRRTEWKCFSLIFLFMFSVIPLFFIFAVAINKWNVYYYFFSHSFWHAFIFNPLGIHVHSTNIWISDWNVLPFVCLISCGYPFVIMQNHFRSRSLSLSLSLINDFIIKYLSRNFMNLFFFLSLLSLLAGSPPATFLSFFRSFDDIFHLCCDL